jgi:hypothetical protein
MTIATLGETITAFEKKGLYQIKISTSVVRGRGKLKGNLSKFGF